MKLMIQLMGLFSAMHHLRFFIMGTLPVAFNRMSTVKIGMNIDYSFTLVIEHKFLVTFDDFCGSSNSASRVVRFRFDVGGSGQRFSSWGFR